MDWQARNIRYKLGFCMGKVDGLNSAGTILYMKITSKTIETPKSFKNKIS